MAKIARQKIAPCLWFDDQAEEAAKYYVSIFEDSKMGEIGRYDEAGGKAAGKPAGSVMIVTFQLAGQEFMALNGGPQFAFSEAISLLVHCESQAEVDRLWETLSTGGEEGPCGWLKDQYGLSWQIVPTVVNELLGSADRQKASRAMEAILAMGKIDIEALRQAYEQG